MANGGDPEQKPKPEGKKPTGKPVPAESSRDSK